MGSLPEEELKKLTEDYGHCAACFNGEYPTAVTSDTRKDKFERKFPERKKSIMDLGYNKKLILEDGSEYYGYGFGSDSRHR